MLDTPGLEQPNPLTQTLTPTPDSDPGPGLGAVCRVLTDNAAVVPILFWGHKNFVSFAAPAALALDDLSVGHPAASGEEGGGGNSDTKCCKIKFNVTYWFGCFICGWIRQKGVVKYK